MKTRIANAAACFLFCCIPAAAVEQAPPAEERAGVGLTQEQEALLARRVEDSMGETFASFAVKFEEASRRQLGTGIGLRSSSQKIRDAALSATYLPDYKPTLREFLDAVALQVSAEWRFGSGGKAEQGKPGQKVAAGDLVAFEFTEARREWPFRIERAEGWTSENRGAWAYCLSPDRQVYFGVCDKGSYSADDKNQEQDLLRKVRETVAITNARRSSGDWKVEELEAAKVGEFDALFADGKIMTSLHGDTRCRTWVFLAGNRCYLVECMNNPEEEAPFDSTIEKMLKTFTMEKK